MSALDAARALAPVLSERAFEGEEARTRPADVVEQVRASGLFDLAIPAVLGGPPQDAATIIGVAGGGALYDSSPLQRRFRDLHAASRHFAMSLSVQRGVGRAVLGLDPASILF